MISCKWLTLGLYSCLLCDSSSFVEAKRLQPSDQQWENIFDRAHELPPGTKRSTTPKGKDKGKKKDDGKTSSTPAPTIAPTRSPVVSKVYEDEEDEDEAEESVNWEAPIPTLYPTKEPTTQPTLTLSSSVPVQPDLNLLSAPLLDFQISVTSETSLDLDRLEKGMETTLRLGIVLVDVKEIQFSTTPAQVNSQTYSFSDGSALVENKESVGLLQTQQRELLSDLSFVESALQQELEDGTIRVQEIEIMEQNVLLPSAHLIHPANDNETNAALMIAATVVCLITFCAAAAVCYRRYKSIKK
ncbi:hypothetical protein FisN_30Lh101 [Fistulifera solaris]|uniref:Uncharacterized protein n=1 Tax=Fistulifera solaris TaxID=1519565 RepID=A0A1Z5JIH4_FISSO|nr:hypothetical protein FisN_30Lh101 [Fistulifera solaris]|eukprot:GAX13807.1 hypothetical protein FisN_30Lh101 [Fistulifera solaris]